MKASHLLAQNINAALVLVGFVALETGISRLWSWPVAAIVGGSMLMAAGAWAYVVQQRKH